MGNIWNTLVWMLLTASWESIAITNNWHPIEQRGSVRNFRHIPGPSSAGFHTEWEVGLREAVIQALLRERYQDPNLRERLLAAPLLGKQNTATPFGDIAVLARGQLYVTYSGNFVFIQDQYQNDCDDCHTTRNRCFKHQCEVWKSHQDKKLVALWTVKRIRHRDFHDRPRFELEYIVSPIGASISEDFVIRNGRLDYAIPGHVFIVKHAETNAPTEPYPAVYHRKIPRDHHKEVLVGIAADGRKFILQSYPAFYTSIPVHPTYHHEGYNTNDPKEIELYKALVESLAAKTSSTQKGSSFGLNQYDKVPNKIYPTKPGFSAMLPSQIVPLTEITSPTLNVPIKFPETDTTKPTLSTLLSTQEGDAIFDEIFPPKVTQPISTTVHYFTPEEQPLTTVEMKEMMKVTLQTTPKPNTGEQFPITQEEIMILQTTLKPLKTTEDVQKPTPTLQVNEIIIPVTDKATTPLKTTKKTYKPKTTTAIKFTKPITKEEGLDFLFPEIDKSTASTKPTGKYHATITSDSRPKQSTTKFTTKTEPTTASTRTSKYTTQSSAFEDFRPKQSTSKTNTVQFTTRTVPTTASTTTSKYTTQSSAFEDSRPKQSTSKTTTGQFTTRTVPTTASTTTSKSTTQSSTFEDSRPKLSTAKKTTLQFTTKTEPTTASPTTSKSTTQSTTFEDSRPKQSTTKITTVKLTTKTATSKPTTASTIRTSRFTTQPTSPKSTTSKESTTEKLTTKLTTTQDITTNSTKVAEAQTTTKITTEELPRTTKLDETSSEEETIDMNIVPVYPTEPMKAMTLLPTEEQATTNQMQAPVDLDITIPFATTQKMQESTREGLKDETLLSTMASNTDNVRSTQKTTTMEEMEKITGSTKTSEDTTELQSNTLPMVQNETVATENTPLIEETTVIPTRQYIITTINADGSHTVETKTTPEYLKTETTAMTKVPSSSTVDDFLAGNGGMNNQRPIKGDYNEDDIFGEAMSEPTRKSTTTKLTQSEFANDLFGSRSAKSFRLGTSTTKEPKVIYSNFYEASTIPMSETTTKGVVTEIEATKPLTSQSYATSISFEVNKNNKTNVEEESTIKATVSEIMKDSTGYTVYKAELPEETTTEANTTKEFENIALQLVNHARSIEYLSRNSDNRTTRAKYKRRRNYVSKTRRTSSKKKVH